VILTVTEASQTDVELVFIKLLMNFGSTSVVSLIITVPPMWMCYDNW